MFAKSFSKKFQQKLTVFGICHSVYTASPESAGPHSRVSQNHLHCSSREQWGELEMPGFTQQSAKWENKVMVQTSA